MKLSADKNILESKKFRAAILASVAVVVVFAAAMITMVLKPEIAQHVQSLAGTTIAFFLAVVSVLITGQSAVDWKQSNAVANIVTEEKRAEHTDITTTERVIIEDMAERYKGDPSYRPIEPDATEVFR